MSENHLSSPTAGITNYDGQKKLIHDWALRYVIERKWKIFPCHSIVLNSKGKRVCACGERGACIRPGKHPALPNGLLGASSDPAQAEAWFTLDGPLLNIGLACGAGSGVTVYDIDCGVDKNGKQKVGLATWQTATGDHGDPPTLMARTGSGGLHLFFRYNAAIPSKNDFLGKHVDTKNDGGFVILAPSLHVSGGIYEWI